MSEEDKSTTPINVAVFIDYENVYKALLAQHTNVLHLGFFEKLRKWCADHNRRIVSMVVYCNFDNDDLHESYHQSILQRYGVETVHTSNQGKNYADLKIAIDVLTSIYSNDNIDEFFIMSNDKDMTPLLNTIRANKRNVAIITTGDKYNHAICEFADRHITLEEICEISIEHQIIDDIANEYWEKYLSFINKRIDEYEVPKFSHYEIDYNISNEMAYTKIMSYELATIIKSYYNQGKIFFYNYVYRTKSYVAFAPTDRKDDMVAKGIIEEKDIIEHYDIQSVVDDFYLKASGQKSS